MSISRRLFKNHIFYVFSYEEIEKVDGFVTGHVHIHTRIASESKTYTVNDFKSVFMNFVLVIHCVSYTLCYLYFVLVILSFCCGVLVSLCVTCNKPYLLYVS
jgi:hypothetical protein